MAAITALAGKVGVLTINSVTVKLARWKVNINNDVIEFATTGQTADGDSQYWKYVLSGLNSASIEVDGYWDSNATANARFTGSTIGLRPGTGAAGTVYCGFKTGTDGFTATVVVESITGGIDVESTKPSTFSATLRIDGAVTYPS